MKTLQEYKAELLADGIIDANEVKELEQLLFADGKIDSEEADFLFELNDAVTGKDNDCSWKNCLSEQSFLIYWRMNFLQGK